MDPKELELLLKLSKDINDLKKNGQFDKEHVTTLISDAKTTADKAEMKGASEYLGKLNEKVNKPDYKLEDLNIASEVGGGKENKLSSAKKSVNEAIDKIPGEPSLHFEVPASLKLKELPKKMLQGLEISNFGYIPEVPNMGTTLRTTPGGIHLDQELKLKGVTLGAGLAFEKDKHKNTEFGPAIDFDDIHLKTKRKDMNLSIYTDVDLSGNNTGKKDYDATFRAEWKSKDPEGKQGIGKFLGKLTKFAEVSVEDIGDNMKPSANVGLQFNFGDNKGPHK